MDATAFVYDLTAVKGKSKTYLIRAVFGYKDFSHNGKYSYERSGELTPYIHDKWGKSVIIAKREHVHIVSRIFKDHKIAYTQKDVIVD